MSTNLGVHRVLVVDDSAFMRKAIPMLLSGEAGLEVAGTARDGKDALEKIASLHPDVVTLDLEMPVMDGMTALAAMMKLPPPRPLVLVCSTLTSAGSHAALKAMQLGATDFITKNPTAIGSGSAEFRAELLTKLRAVLEGRPTRAATAGAPGATGGGAALPTTRPAGAAQAPRSFSLAGRTFDLVLIGSSTGGPPVLEQILTQLPADFPAPIVIAQHMPAMFTKSLAERLDEMSAVSVHQASGVMPLSPGSVFVATGGQHAVVRRSAAGRLSVETTGEPASALYKPSVDVLLASAPNPARTLAIVLTGMGADGALGAARIAAGGGLVVGQAAETCAVYGMPKAVFENKSASAMLSPGQIASALRGLVPGLVGGGGGAGGGGKPEKPGVPRAA